MLQFSCDDGFTLHGSRDRKCQTNGMWSGTNAFCKGRMNLLRMDTFSPTSQVKANCFYHIESIEKEIHNLAAVSLLYLIDHTGALQKSF